MTPILAAMYVYLGLLAFQVGFDYGYELGARS